MRFWLGRHSSLVERELDALLGERAVERIWQRDPTFWGGDDARSQSVANRLGWLDIAAQMKPRLSELASFKVGVAEAGFTSIVLLGMGGSSLASEVLRRSFEPPKGAPRLFVLDSTDPATIRAVERAIDPQRTLFFVSSKSGGTIEVATLFAYFWNRVVEVNPDDPGKNFAAITDPDTSLAALGRERGFRAVFENPPDIGGRYSALSYFGLAPAAGAGLDVERLLASGVEAEQAARQEGSDALKLGAALGALAKGGRNKLTLLVAPELAALGLWLEQLIAESTGKDGSGILPVAGEPPGSPHKYSQDRVFVQIRSETGFSGDYDSVVAGLVAEGHPAIIIDLDSPYELGAQFVAWEFATAVAGKALGINPFDEPNVQESKDNTARVLARYDASNGSSTPGGRDASVASADVDAMRGLLDSLSEDGYFAITSFMRETAESTKTFADIRTWVRDAHRIATTLGYGPRYLHSTGQLHKGGPAGGVFLQVVQDETDDIAIPGKPYTFGQLKRAQADGDLDSLRAHRREVLRVNLRNDVAGGLAGLRQSMFAAIHGPVAGRRR